MKYIIAIALILLPLTGLAGTFDYLEPSPQDQINQLRSDMERQQSNIRLEMELNRIRSYEEAQRQRTETEYLQQQIEYDQAMRRLRGGY